MTALRSGRFYGRHMALALSAAIVSRYHRNSPELDGSRLTDSMTNDPKPAYAIGQYVQIYPTIPSSHGGSIESGTRGIVRDIDLTQPDDDVYLVEFRSSERFTGETAWLREVDLFPA